MTIDTNKVTPQSARWFPSHCGGYGVKMKLAKEPDNELLFGQYRSGAMAEQVAAIANGFTDGKYTVEQIEKMAESSMKNREVRHAKVA